MGPLAERLKALALIPARAGSKGIPGKNIQPVAGHPLIHWTIDAAQQAQGLDRIIVSTDDVRIAEIAQRSGAEVPFLRPAELATDNISNIWATLHALRWLESQEGYVPDCVVLLQPTSPLRSSEDIDEPLKMLSEPGVPAVLSVSPVLQHPYLMRQIAPDGTLNTFSPESYPVGRRQDFPPVYVQNGAVYTIRTSALLQHKTYEPQGTRAYVMPTNRSLDIDSWQELRLADLILGDPPLSSR